MASGSRNPPADDVVPTADSHDRLWCSTGVAHAVATCREKAVPLLVFVEPSESVVDQSPSQWTRAEALANTYARRAVAAMHRVTFAHQEVRSVIAQEGAVLIRLQDGISKDFTDFASVFVLPSARPALYVISSSGKIHFLKTGFVSPKQFVSGLCNAVQCSANKENPLPKEQSDPNTTDVGTKSTSSPSLTEHIVDNARFTGSSSGSGHGDVAGALEAKQASAISENEISASETREQCLRSSTESNAGLISLAVRVTDGTLQRRCFSGSEQFSAAREWISGLYHVNPAALILGMTYPRRIIPRSDDMRTLNDLDLAPSATLFARLDSEATVGPPTIASRARSALDYVISFIQSVFRWFVNSLMLSRNRHSAPGQSRSAGTRSMAELRRRDDSENGGLSYDNGNSTQFSSGDGRDEAKKNR